MLSEEEITAEEELKERLHEEIIKRMPFVTLNFIALLIFAFIYWFVFPLFVFLEGIMLINQITALELLQLFTIVMMSIMGYRMLFDFFVILDAWSDFFISKLPGVRSEEKDSLRRVPKDIIYIFIVFLAYLAIEPFILSVPVFGNLIFLVLPYITLAIVLIFIYDTAKSIYFSLDIRIKSFWFRKITSSSKEEKGKEI